MSATVLGGGFRDVPVEASRVFRAAMNAMARPGDIQEVEGVAPPAPLSMAAGALLLTLCDPDTGVYLAGVADTETVRTWLGFHTGAPFVSADRADFAVGSWVDLMPLDQYRIGTAEFPDRSTTLIVEMPRIAGSGPALSGPGIRDTAHLSLPDTAAMQRNAMLYPLGVDFFLTSGSQIAALPRSTQISEA